MNIPTNITLRDYLMMECLKMRVAEEVRLYERKKIDLIPEGLIKMAFQDATNILVVRSSTDDNIPQFRPNLHGIFDAVNNTANDLAAREERSMEIEKRRKEISDMAKKSLEASLKNQSSTPQ